MDSKNTSLEAHRAEACKHLSIIGKKLFKFVEFDNDEELIVEIRKHPVGIIGLALSSVFIGLAILVGAIMLGSNLEKLGFVTSDGDGALKNLILVTGILLTILVLIIGAVSIALYVLDVIYVTNQKIAEVEYVSLFNRKITQLGIGQVEDVTDNKKGIFAYIFNFGTLIIETAGEKENATFNTVPKPNYYSQIIIQAHDESVKHYGN